jgi:hypothetical protein
MPSGFLVVLADARNRATGGPYAGVARVPYYHPSGDVRVGYAEKPAINEYVFGDVRDEDTNLIPSLEGAVKLSGMLRSGGRQFEIIYCRDVERPFLVSLVGIASIECLGYDVADTGGTYYSIVEVFSIGAWATPHAQRLNANGLFGEQSDAEAYLRDYRARKENKWHAPFDVVEVMRVTPM